MSEGKQLLGRMQADGGGGGSGGGGWEQQQQQQPVTIRRATLGIPALHSFEILTKLEPRARRGKQSVKQSKLQEGRRSEGGRGKGREVKIKNKLKKESLKKNPRNPSFLPSGLPPSQPG